MNKQNLQKKPQNTVVSINLSDFYVFWFCFFFILDIFLQFLIKICMHAKPNPWETHIYMKMCIVGTLFTEIKYITFENA